MISPFFILCLIIGYFLVLVGIAYATGKDDTNERNDYYNNAQVYDDVPYFEYHQLNMLVANMIATMRISIMDYEMYSFSEYMDNNNGMVFWLLWIITTICTCIIFINFLIA